MNHRPFSPLWIVCLACYFGSASAETIAIIGTGNVASALGPEFALQGHDIVYGSRNPESEKVQELLAKSGDGAAATSPAQAVTGADVVVLAVPGTLVGEIVAGLGDLPGKVVIDPTNPIILEGITFRHAVATSNTRIIQDLLPEANVVKAFNTLGWQAMKDPETAGGPLSIPLAGDSESAKAFVATLASGMGLDPIDVGSADDAHWLEGMAILLLNNRFGARESFDYYLRRSE